MQNRKNKYEKPDLDMIHLGTDIVTLSNSNGDGGSAGFPEPTAISW